MAERKKGTNRRRRRKSVEGREALVDSIGGESGNKAESSRVLLDVIRDVDDPNAGAYRSLINHDNHKKNWKAFKDRLRLKRASQAWISAMPDDVERRSLELLPPEEESGAGEERKKVLRPQLSRMTSFQPPENIRDDVPISDPIMRRPQILRHNSSRLSSSSMNARQGEDVGPRVRFADQLAAEKEQIQRVVSSTEAFRHKGSDSDEEAQEEGIPTGFCGGGGEPGVKMSLMDLLEETDDQIGWASYMAELEDDEDEDDEEDEGAEEQTCCICMVRHKGRASALCGHTFCRLCSKELSAAEQTCCISVGRGNCPRCNSFVLEILEIF